MSELTITIKEILEAIKSLDDADMPQEQGILGIEGEDAQKLLEIR